jgi:maltose O-acetyltransferase
MPGLLNRFYDSFMRNRKEKYLANLCARGLKIGKNVSIVDAFFFDPSHCYLISIGDNCTICPNVRLIAHDASTKRFLGYTKFGKIKIGDNCFIGDSTIILPDVAIGPNTIIGSGSIVTRDIPPNTVAAGNPAKPICSLETYLSRMRNLAENGKNIFSEEYLCENLDTVKRAELISKAEDSIGFIK